MDLEKEQLKKRIQELERRMGLGEHDPSKEAYLVLVDLLRQQSDYLKTFKISEKIASLAKEDAVYPRANEMWEKLPNMIRAVANLRIELKMDEDDKSDMPKRISPKSIANGEV